MTQARIVAAAQGARWLAEGWRLFLAAPAGWLAVAFTYALIMVLMSAVPVVGSAAFLVLYPALTVGLMAAARAASRRAPIEVGMLFDGFRHGARAQLVLGAVYLACTIAVFAASFLADDQAALRSVLSGRREPDAAMGDVVLSLGVMAGLYAPMLMLFWFAPPLAAWHGIGPAKALFFSFVACMMNWRALVLYSVATLAAILALVSLVVFVFTFAWGAAPGAVALPVVLVVVIALVPTLFASFYASYRDVFGEISGPS